MLFKIIVNRINLGKLRKINAWISRRMSSSRSKLKLTQYGRANKYLIPLTELNAIAIINEITNNYKVIITSLNNMSQNRRKT